jgi:hypothetical protein
MSQYNYTKTPCSIDRLTQEIQKSSIVTALDHIDLNGSDLSIFFKSDLSNADKTTLDTLVVAHDGTPLPDNKIIQVQTQFEVANKTLKLFCAEADVQSDSTATILVAIPGTPGSGDGRYINSGEAFFDVSTAGDKIIGVWFVDHDNLLGGGVDAVVGSYTDDVASSINQGWYLPPVRGTVKAETIGYYGFAPSGFYIKIVGKKANGIVTGKLYVNMEWATQG